MRQLTIDDFIKEEQTEFVITWLDGVGVWHHERVTFNNNCLSSELINWRQKNPNKYFRCIEQTGGAEN